MVIKDLEKISSLNLRKEIERRKQLVTKENVGDLELNYLVGELAFFSGQKRASLLEDWFANNIYTNKVPAKLDKGDLTNNKIWDELKTRFLTQKEIGKGTLHQCGQVRLWQKTDNYLFLTVNLDTLEVFIYYIPKKDLINLIKQGKVSYSSSHVKGNSKIKEGFLNSDFNSKMELHLTLSSNSFNFNQYLISIKELKNKLN